MKHEFLNFKSLESYYSGTPLKDYDWSPFCSPFNIWCGEKLRSLISVSIAPSAQVATDLIVWGRGEPNSPAVTKVGGAPVWSSDGNFPKKMGYFGQVGLMDSPFALSKDKGDVVSIWGDQDFPYGKIKVFLLNSRDLAHFPDADSVNIVAGKEPFYGVLYRSFDLPIASRENLPETSVQGELGIRKFRFSPWKGSKIGGVPSAVDEDMSQNFVLQIMSIQGHPEQRYPWVNSEDKLTLSGGSKNSYTADENSVTLGDMGFITVISRNGGIEAKFTA